MLLTNKQLQEIATLLNVTVATIYNNVKSRPITIDGVYAYANNVALERLEDYEMAEQARDAIFDLYIKKDSQS